MLSRFSTRRYTLLPIVATALMTALVVSSCKKAGYDYQAIAAIANINITVGLSQSHPFLAEYNRTVRIEDGIPISLGLDSGGEAYVNVYETPNELILQTFYTHVLVIDKATKAAVKEERPLTKTEIDSFVGAFDFVDLEAYQFIEGDENSTFDPSVVKGG